MAFQLGPHQAAIVEALTDGPHSLAALVARIDATRPRLVTDALERLRQRRIVEVTGRKGRSMTAATVRLVPPESRIPEQVPTRRSVGDDARWLAPYLRP